MYKVIFLRSYNRTHQSFSLIRIPVTQVTGKESGAWMAGHELNPGEKLKEGMIRFTVAAQNFQAAKKKASDWLSQNSKPSGKLQNYAVDRDPAYEQSL